MEASNSKHGKTDVMPLRADLAKRIQEWIAAKKKLKNFDPTIPLLNLAKNNTAHMLRMDMMWARAAWIKEGSDDEERQRREKSSFLKYQNEHGHYADFHALRKTFITNLCRSGVSPKTAQLLARHSDINLTMNTYTTLGVLDQAATVESLPAIPEVPELPVVQPKYREWLERLRAQ